MRKEAKAIRRAVVVALVTAGCFVGAREADSSPKPTPPDCRAEHPPAEILRHFKSSA